MNDDQSNSTVAPAGAKSGSTQGVTHSRPPIGFWIAATVVVVAMICGTYLLSRLISLADRVAQVPSEVSSIPTKMAEGIARAFKTSVNARTTIDTTIGQVRRQANLVVMQAAINVSITKSSEKSTLWGTVYLGTTTVTVRAQDNRVQYIVPLEGFSSSDLSFDPRTDSLIVKIAAPRLDESLIEVQSDPSKISVQTDVGWARLDSSSGKFNREQAMKDLRPSVIRQARHPLLMDKARASAKEDMLKLLAPITGQLRDGVKVVVEFKE